MILSNHDQVDHYGISTTHYAVIIYYCIVHRERERYREREGDFACMFQAQALRIQVARDRMKQTQMTPDNGLGRLASVAGPAYIAAAKGKQGLAQPEPLCLTGTHVCKQLQEGEG